jgi:hypothetical protein
MPMMRLNSRQTINKRIAAGGQNFVEAASLLYLRA